MAKLDYTEALKVFDNYISDNLEEVDLIDEGIKATFVSKFHFYRFFKAITGMTVNGYIVERRLINVLRDLMGEMKIMTIALDNGFTSNEVMTRNFRKTFGHTPAAFRKMTREKQEFIYTQQTKAMKLDFKSLDISINHKQGTIDAIDHIIVLEEMYLIGKSRNSTDSMVNTIPDFVNEVAQALEVLDDIAEEALYRICHSINDSKEIPSFIEFVGIPVTKGTEVPEGFEFFKRQPCRVLKFQHKGPLYSREEVPVINTYELIYKYRLPSMKVLPTDQYYIERYGDDFLGVFESESVMTIMMTVGPLESL